MSGILEAAHLSKQYGRVWALRDCTMSIPEGRIAAIVGPNGAGKSTLLQVSAGLLPPSDGKLTVLGHSPFSEPHTVLCHIGFVAQEHPLYSSLTVEETLLLGRKLNARWDDALAKRRLNQLDIPLKRRVGRLSGGQQAQVALVAALAKHPKLLLLDEPLASLDPLARRDFLGVVLDEAAESGMTVLLSSHIISDLERVCDFLIVLTGGVVRLASDLEDAMRIHKRLTGPRQNTSAIASRHAIVDLTDTPAQMSMVVRLDGPLFDTSWETHDLSLEEVVLAYLGQVRHDALPRKEVTEAHI